MSTWVITAVLGYFLLAINGVADKFLLTKAVKQPAVYAFFVGIGSIAILFLIPFGMTVPSLGTIMVALFSGVSFILALLFFYAGIQRTSVSRILPIEGGLVPIFTLLFAYPIVGELLHGKQFIAFIFLVVGAVMVAFKRERSSWQPKALQSATFAAIFFALSLVLSKYVYNAENVTFVSGLIWTRLGLFIAALCLLIPKGWRHAILYQPKQQRKGNIFLFYGAQAAAAAAGLLQNYAVAEGNVTIVNALQGTQFAFALVVTSLLSIYFPKVLKEKITGLIMLQKIVAIGLITIGLWFLGVT